MKNSMGGVKPSLPISQRIVQKITEPNYFGKGHRHYEIDIFPHEPGNFHNARFSRIPHLSWAIYRLRRKRVGQLSLFGNAKKPKAIRKIRNIVPYWGYGVSQWHRKGKAECKAH